MNSARWLSLAELRQMIADVETRCADFDIRIPDDCALQGVLANLRWMVSFNSDPSGPGGAWENDRERTALILQSCVYFESFARALASIRDAAEASFYRNHLRNLAMSGSGRDLSKADDLFYEVDLLGRWRRRKITVQFAEPDLVVEAKNGLRFGVACKRPRAADSLANAVKGGCQQIARAGLPGFVMLSLDLPFGGSRRAPSRDPWPSETAIHEAARYIIAAALDQYRGELDAAIEQASDRTESTIFGVGVSCTLLGFWKQSAALGGFTWKYAQGYHEYSGCEIAPGMLAQLLGDV